MVPLRTAFGYRVRMSDEQWQRYRDEKAGGMRSHPERERVNWTALMWAQVHVSIKCQHCGPIILSFCRRLVKL